MSINLIFTAENRNNMHVGFTNNVITYELYVSLRVLHGKTIDVILTAENQSSELAENLRCELTLNTFLFSC